MQGSAALEDVSLRVGDVLAVRDLALHVRAGEFLTLLGPSGCGKTTILRLLAGLAVPDRGVVRLDGADVTGVPAHRRDVNTVFQQYALFPHLDVWGNVAFGLRQRRVPRAELRARVGAVLEQVHMSGLARRRPRELSGGQQQRVALARALVNRPAVLLLDEPLAALDRALRQELQIELKLLQVEVATTFVYVTHDQEEALSLSDRVAVLREGGLQQIGAPDEVWDHPATAFVAGLVGGANLLHGVAGPARDLRGEGFAVHGAIRRDGVAAGRPAVAAVRPDAVRVSADRPALATNALAGTLATVAHLGETVRYLVRGPTWQLTARVPRPHAPQLTPGTVVWCSWPAHAATLFGAEGAAPLEETAEDRGAA